MHIQIVNFSLESLSPSDYEKHCENVASAFAAMPGLLAKFWLADPASNTYGGVYVWQDRNAFEAYVTSETFAALEANPHLVDLRSSDFDILRGPSEITRALQFSPVG